MLMSFSARSFSLIASALCCFVLGCWLFLSLTFNSPSKLSPRLLKHAEQSALDQGRFSLSRHDYTHARLSFEEAVLDEEQQLEAHYFLGLMDLYGWGAARDLDAGMGHLQPLIETGDKRALLEAGVVHSQEGTSWTDYDTAVEYFLMAAADNNVFAERNLGILYAQGHGTQGVKESWELSDYWLERARNHGFKEASFALAINRLQRGGFDSLKDDVLPLLQESAESNFPPSLLLLGSLHWRHPQETGEPDKAGDYFKQAASHQSAEGAYRYSLWLEQFPEKQTESRKWLERSAEQGFAQGLKYEQGLKGDALRASALRYYEQAATQGHARALNRLGLVSHRGLYGQNIDTAKAHKYFEQAAECGLPEAQNNLGLLMIYSDNADVATAAHWIKRAAEQGYEPALKNLQILQSRQQFSQTSSPENDVL